MNMLDKLVMKLEKYLINRKLKNGTKKENVLPIKKKPSLERYIETLKAVENSKYQCSNCGGSFEVFRSKFHKRLNGKVILILLKCKFCHTKFNIDYYN